MDTENKILDAAYYCFVNFGYTSTSIVMVGKYADLSRFTVHKYYKNKETLFRATAIRFGQKCMDECRAAVQSDKNVWDKIEKVTEIWFAPIFDTKNDPVVLADVQQAFDQHLTEVVAAHREFNVALFENELDAAVARNEINLSQLGYSTKEIAVFLSTSIHGIKKTIDIDVIHDYIEQLIQVYRVATFVTKTNS